MDIVQTQIVGFFKWLQENVSSGGEHEACMLYMFYLWTEDCDSLYSVVLIEVKPEVPTAGVCHQLSTLSCACQGIL